MGKKKFSKAMPKKAVLVAVFCLLVIGALFVYAGMLERMIDSDCSAMLQEMSNQGKIIVNDRIKNDFDKLHTTASLIAEMDDIQGKEAMDLLRKKADSNPSLLRYGVIDPKGNVLTTDEREGDVSFTDTYLVSIKGDEYISDPVADYLFQEKEVFYLSVPIYKNETIQGVLSCVYTVDIYEELVSYTIFGGKGHVYVLKKDGRVVLSPQNVEKHISLNKKESFEKNAKFQQIPDLRKLPEQMHQERSGTIKYKSAETGNNYLSYLPAGVNDWYFVTIVPTNVMVNKINAVERLSSFVLFTTFVMIIIFIRFIYNGRKKRDIVVEHMAFVDDLTGMNTEKKLIDCYPALDNLQKRTAVLIDINKFREVNTIFGYDVGNQMLKRMSEPIKNGLKEDEHAFRLDNGDRFLVLFNGTEQNLLMRRIREIASEMEKINVQDGGVGYSYNCTVACGLYPLTEKDTSILKVIDMVRDALKLVKKDKQNTYVFFNDNIKEKMALKSILSVQIGNALTRKEFVPYYQPKYDLQTMEVAGAEILARWQHPQKGILMPEHFINIMESEGYIMELDMRMLEMACQKLKSWIDAEMVPVPLAVNISRLNIYKENFVQKIISIVKEYDIPPVLIELEITETAAFEDGEKLAAVAAELKKNGFILSMDDFGSGYSSLNLLRLLPIDIIKLDRNFFGTNMSEREKAVITHVIRMAQELNIEVISEGVETKEQEKLLKSLGCHYVQGFLYSKPLSNEAFEQLIFEE